ncbi:MAG: DUF6930 domain-containing protein [Anaerolineales bacterium]
MIKKETEIPQPHPSPEEWERLFDATVAFKDAKPWEWMYEQQIFGVEEPETGRIGFCSVTGTLGEHVALIVYEGLEGLGRYLQFVVNHERGGGYLQQRETTFSLWEVPQLQASFEDRDLLDKIDYQIIRDAGLRFRGHNAWPRFRYYQPGRVPWYLNAPQVRFLTLMLEQTLVVAEEAQGPGLLALSLGELASVLPATPETVTLPVRVQEEGTWGVELRELEPRYAWYTFEGDLTPFERARQRLTQQERVVQFHVTLIPGMSVSEDEIPPYLTYHMLLVDAEVGFIYGSDMLLARPSLSAMLADVPQRLLSLMEKIDFRPEEVQVASERLYNLLAVPLKQMGVTLNLYYELPALEDALHELENWMEGRFPEDL